MGGRIEEIAGVLTGLILVSGVIFIPASLISLAVSAAWPGRGDAPDWVITGTIIVVEIACWIGLWVASRRDTERYAKSVKWLQ